MRVFLRVLLALGLCVLLAGTVLAADSDEEASEISICYTAPLPAFESLLPDRPEEADPETTMDGGYSSLIIYDKNGDVYKVCGGFCPHNKDFNRMSRVISENLPEEFFKFCDEYKLAWQRVSCRMVLWMVRFHC